jgi:hypothetical protein
LVAPNTLFAWKEYFKEQFPELHIASFSCYPPDATLINDTSTGEQTWGAKLLDGVTWMMLIRNTHSTWHSCCEQFFIAALQRVVKRPRRRFYNAVGVKDVLLACKDVELSKHGVQVEWDNLVKQYDATKKAELQESDSDSDQEHAQERGEGRENLLEKEDDQRLGKLILLEMVRTHFWTFFFFFFFFIDLFLQYSPPSFCCLRMEYSNDVADGEYRG